ncbi:ABC transporter substrate-binding protein [Jiangella anatolica]|uniref:ABC transporter substrate-binding protein n=1 Tax=Jiangella anatolica TaxID=2670374 RepID=A0A2W2BNM1_9ACTN|nr:ABC transporter substrate-binding protein [Jiangella anatolica]PZF81924.1 ABC transporter substrate-binding protein [Jiangella anatolica]
MQDRKSRPRGRLLVVAAVLSLALSACASADSNSQSQSSEPVDGGVFRLATVAEPAGLDPALVFDGDSYRINAQIYETLVTLAPGTTSEVVPALATSYTPNEDATEWTFQLREGVTFHDGTPFDAAAVKFNFDRWKNFPEALQSRAELYGTVFGGFGDAGILESVDVVDERTVGLRLSAPRPDLPITLTLPVFSIASPAALQEYGADEVDAASSEFANEHPVGTGPFVFDSWTHGDRVELVRNEDYWDEPAHLDRIVFKAISDAAARLNAVQAGDVDGADMINPRDVEAVTANSSLQLALRGSCNSGFVAFKSDQEPFDDPRVRQAVSHAINKEAIVDRFFGETGEPAWLLMPESIPFHDDSLENPEYDPDLARELLAEAGEPNPVVDFWYPTDVTRPWLPDSQGIFQAIAADLEAVGFQVTPRSATWTAYLQDSKTPAYGLFLLGWSCDYGAADNFYGGAFGYIDSAPNPRYQYTSDEFVAALETAQVAPEDQREAAWAQVQRIVYDDLPVVPFVHGSSSLAFSTRVHGYEPNPVLVEHLDDVWLSD